MKELYKKLHKIQGKVGAISKDKTNPFYSSAYFDINALINQLTPILQENNLILLQPIEEGCVTSKIIDAETGDIVLSSMQLPNIDDPQKMGSAITYFRRYTLQSLLALQAEDDDGNRASGNTTKAKAKDEPQKPWLNETDKEKWAAAEDWVRDGNHPSTLRKKYALNKLNYSYFESIYNEANK